MGGNRARRCTGRAERRGDAAFTNLNGTALRRAPQPGGGNS
jgi:hypothetical protein